MEGLCYSFGSALEREDNQDALKAILNSIIPEETKAEIVRQFNAELVRRQMEAAKFMEKEKSAE